MILGNFKPFPVSASSIKFFHPHPFLWQQKIKMNKEPNGRIVELTIKSSKSKTPVPAPNGWKFDQRLNPKIHGIEKTSTMIQFTRQDFFLDQPCASIQ